MTHKLSNVNLERGSADCSVCGPDVDVSVWYPKSPTRSPRPACREARRQSSRKHRKNGGGRREKTKIWARRDWISQLKAATKCPDCGRRYAPCAMDFDHVNASTKYMIISQMYNRPVGQILYELSKCEIVCSNCHRVREYRRARS